jgi:transposase
MPAKRISMRKIHDVLRLKWAAELSSREIAQATGVARSTVSDYLRRAEEAGLSWPLPDGLDHAALERVLFKQPERPSRARPLPDWAVVHRELRRKGVTLWLLWEEYCAAHAGAACYSYTRFCELYRAWRGSLDVVMRQTHAPGEKLFVDYAGQTVPIVDPTTGVVREVQLFVAVFGASNYTFVVATEGQDLRSWIGAHEEAFRFFGGVPRIVVPDNLKAGVSKAHRYEPDVNPTYQDMAEHYGVAVIPTRSAAPRDKAKAENGVLVAERWILARLRNRTFFSIGELNEAIGELLDALNDRAFQKLPGCRRTAFEELDRPALGPLPSQRYVFAEWRKRRAGLDYHVEVDGHYYSVPYREAKKVFDVRVTANTVECFLKGRRVASHVRSPRPGQHTTVREHMPKAHQQYAEWTPERIAAWAEKIGPATAELTRTIIGSRRHPEQGYRSCLGILRLAKAYGEVRLEGACRRALAIGARSYKSVASILKSGLDQQPLPGQAHDEPIEHENIRGALYYINNQGKN